MRDNPKICHYLDLPLQHISTPILKAMRRGIDREQTIAFVNKVRSFVPDVAFRSTFIVGFPVRRMRSLRNYAILLER